MSFLRRLLTLLFAVMVFFGSGGWVLTDHLCRKAGDSCNSGTEQSCCCSGEKEVPTQQKQQAESLLSNAAPDCCVNNSSYFSMPLFRAETSPDHYLIHAVADGIVAYSDAVCYGSRKAVSIQDHSPPLLKQGELILRLTGQLLI